MKNNLQFEKFLKKLIFASHEDSLCLSDETIQNFIEKKLNSVDRQDAVDHFADCPHCFEKMLFYRDILMEEKALSQSSPQKIKIKSRWSPGLKFAMSAAAAALILIAVWSFFQFYSESKPHYQIAFLNGQIDIERNGLVKPGSIGMYLHDGDILRSFDNPVAMSVIEPILDQPSLNTLRHLQLTNSQIIKITKSQALGEQIGTIPKFDVVSDSSLVALYEKLPTIQVRGTYDKANLLYLTPQEPVYSTRPVFEWECNIVENIHYQIILTNSAGDTLIRIESNSNRVDYPEKRNELIRGELYKGKVFALQQESVIGTERFSFQVSGGSEAQGIEHSLKRILELGYTDNSAKLTLQGLLFHSKGYFCDALWVFQRILTIDPGNKYAKEMVRFLEAKLRGGKMD